ncbi:energy transducer TonB [Oleiagrimonas soli]|uniref:TonB C-terminal domain-containing protein n=1 Tax=Oleiagrimonas soli TaxID=1543381 RepID=A0A099CSU7_9GAMM|nr:energy transducer TonB [Oleiagrimonas soli]KGI76712.1 hypothetical protein LF63_0114215 [Oleiagrimonas soli]MBB6185061.1 hypothetical protein [Oleiagrimonas soli]
MKKAWFAGVICSLLPVCAMAAQAGASYRYVVGVDVNAQGGVTDVQVPAGVSAPIGKLLDATVRQWHFHPATLNHQAQPSHTYVYLRMDMRKTTDGRGMLLLRYTANGPRLKPGQSMVPEYPANERRQHRSAFLRLTGEVMPDGRLDHVKIQNLVAGERVDGDFRAAVMAMAEKARFESVTIGGTPVATTVKIPVYFALRDARGGSAIAVDHKQWLFLKKLQAERKAQDDAAVAASSMPLDSGQVASVDGPLRPDRILPVKVRLTP